MRGIGIRGSEMAELVMIFTAVSNAEIEVWNPLNAFRGLAVIGGSNIERVEYDISKEIDKDGFPMQATVRVYTYDFLTEGGNP